MRVNLGMKVCTWAMVSLVAAGLARAQDGDASIVGWGREIAGVDLSADFVAVEAGWHHSLGLKDDGSIVAWAAGELDFAQCDVPEPNTHFVAISAGDAHSLALKDDGSIVAWGDI
jgi:alpha-tubulin suppressor-like RCC1 family protein